MAMDAEKWLAGKREERKIFFWEKGRPPAPKGWRFSLERLKLAVFGEFDFFSDFLADPPLL